MDRPQQEAPGRVLRDVRTAGEFRAYARGRLIESRLTPNAISLTGLILNLSAAALITQKLFFLAGVAFIVGSVMDTLDGRYSRMSGKGTLFGAFLDSTLDRIEEGVVLTAAANSSPREAKYAPTAASTMPSSIRSRVESRNAPKSVPLPDIRG